MTFPARVDDAGNVTLPAIGQVAVAGLVLREAENTIAASAIGQGQYRNPLVTVTMKTKHSHRVTLLGAVRNPGVYVLPVQSCDVLSSIATAGGFTEDAGSDVEIRKPGKANLSPPAVVFPDNNQVRLSNWENRPPGKRCKSIWLPLKRGNRKTTHCPMEPS